MIRNDDRDKRWLAYFLGDATPDERERVEAELRDAPDDAAAFRALVEGVSAWAKEPVPYVPVDLEALERAQAAACAQPAPPRLARVWFARAAALAALALLVLGLSQVQFTLALGDTALHWGRQSAPEATTALSQDVQTLTRQVQHLERVTEETGGKIQSLALRNAAVEEQFRNAAIRLAHNQRVEAQARYRGFQDLQELLYVASYAQDAEPVVTGPGIDRRR